MVLGLVVVFLEPVCVDDADFFKSFLISENLRYPPNQRSI